MILISEIVESYLNEKSIDKHKNHWIYTSVGQGEFKNKNIFTPPVKDISEPVLTLYNQIKTTIINFIPYNNKIFSTLFPNWNEALKNLEIHLVVGLPEPNDACVIPNPNGDNVIIFDLDCWTNYIDKVNIIDLTRNLLTHEISHILIAKIFPKIDSDYENGDYFTKLNSLIFNEGFAHLLSFKEDINDIDLNSKELINVKFSSLNKFKKSIAETNIHIQNKYLYDAVFGNYYDKFGCMVGMVYLLDKVLKSNVDSLLNEFKLGYSDIISRIINYYGGYYETL